MALRRERYLAQVAPVGPLWHRAAGDRRIKVIRKINTRCLAALKDIYSRETPELVESLVYDKLNIEQRQLIVLGDLPHNPKIRVIPTTRKQFLDQFIPNPRQEIKIFAEKDFLMIYHLHLNY